MTVTDVRPLDKRRCKVLTDGDFAFVLYRGEIKKLGIKEGEELKSSTLSEIEEILLKRGKERALYILKSGDKTERQIFKKLTDSGYPEQVAAAVLDFLREYNICDDKRYCREFIAQKISRLGERVIREKLIEKGINKELIGECFEEFKAELSSDESSDESVRKLQLEACMKAVRKKAGIKNSEKDLSELLREMDEKRYRSLYMSLMRKGFDGDLIRECLGRRELLT